MHDNDSFRLISTDLAVFVLIVLFGIFASFVGDDKERAVKMEQKAAPAAVPCATIEQYGPGERRSGPPSSRKQPACAGAVLDPNHILTSPIASQQ